MQLVLIIISLLIVNKTITLIKFNSSLISIGRAIILLAYVSVSERVFRKDF